MGGKLQVRRYFTFAMTRRKLCAWTPFEISHFQHVHCPSKNPISPKLINRFSKTLLQLEVVEGGHMGGKFQVRRYFTFAMTRWKVCTSTTFEISHFQPVHCPSKNPISPKVFNRISKTLLQLEVVEVGHLGGNFQVRRYFTSAMARWKLCTTKTLEISHFQPVHCTSKNPISPKLPNRFSKTLLQFDVVEGVHMSGKLQVHRYLTFAMTRWKLCASTTFEISHFEPAHCPSKNPISPKLPNRFSKTLLQFDWFTRWLEKWRSEPNRFYFSNHKVKTLRIDNIWNFPLSTCTLSQQKPYISKVIQPIFENFAKTLGRKLQVHRYFTFAMARWNLCASTTFEISHFQPVHCPSKNPISPKVFNRFSETFLLLEDVEGGHMCGKLEVRRYFTLAMARWKLCVSRTFEISHFQPVHCPSKNPISPKGFNWISKTFLQFKDVEGRHSGGYFQVDIFNRISKTFLQLKDVEGGHLGAYFQVRRYFTFAMARWKLCPTKTFEIFHIQPVHCTSKNPICPKLPNDFRKLCFSSTLLKVCIWVESCRCTGILPLQWQGENFAHRQHLKFPTFNLHTVPAKILCLQRYSTEFRKLCFNSKLLKVGLCVESCRCAGILLLQWPGENFAHGHHLKFPTFNLYTVPAKTLYLQS